MVCNKCLSDKPECKFGTYSNGDGRGRVYTRRQCVDCRISTRDKSKNADSSLKSWHKRFDGNKEAWNEKVRAYRASRKASGNPIIRNCASDKYRKTGRFKIWIRAEVFALKGHDCVYCGVKADTIDHVVALARGGTDDMSNLVPACKSCNSSKQAKPLQQWMAERKEGYFYGDQVRR